MNAQAEQVERVYVWDLVVRLTHWTIAGSIVVLSVTGIYLGTPFGLTRGPAGGAFLMGWMKVIHSYAAIAFTLAVLSRLWWMIAGSRWARWDQFIPWNRQRRRDLWGTFKFYTMITTEPPPAVGHNALAGLTYVAVFGLYLVMIVTGLGLYGMSAHVDSWMRVFAFVPGVLGGAQWTRWLHHVVMWLLIGFTVHHVYSALLMSRVEKNGVLDSIFSGWKFVSRGGRP